MKTNSWMSGLDVAEDCVEICLLDAVCFGICANLLDSGLLDLGTLSADLEKTLEKHSPAGYRVYMHKENPGPAAFEALLTQGNPIVVLIWNGKTLHWTLVTGTYDLNGSTWLRFANNEDLSWDTFVHQWSFAGWNWPVPDIVSSVGIVPYTWMYYQKTTELTSDLLCGNSITSYDGRFTLILQTDGNLVLYWNEPGHPALWSSHTQGKAGYDAEMQEDGNFVIYDAARNALWASGTDGHPGAYLVLQNDGNLVIYDTNDAAIWSSNTCCH
jgi:hypothetical protein